MTHMTVTLGVKDAGFIEQVALTFPKLGLDLAVGRDFTFTTTDAVDMRRLLSLYATHQGEGLDYAVFLWHNVVTFTEINEEL